MKKILFSTILGISVTGAATASIVSRGFFEEAMENYATNTALDLKANQSDLTALSNKIGTLPSGGFMDSPLAHALNRSVQDTDDPVYPDSLAKLIEQIYGTPEHSGILTYILHGFPNPDPAVSSITSSSIGIIGAMQIAENAEFRANRNTAKIGTVPDGKNLAGMISETDAKIGTLPTEYETVGAALSAIKGIAEEAKQKAEAAIPDPKAEGATGKYVLTVDIADSSAIPVYRWEKIDRTLDETQSEQ